MSLPDFIEEMFTFCPHMFAIDANLAVLDSSDPGSLHKFYHDHTTRMAYMNLVCGFDKQALMAKLRCLTACYELEVQRQAVLQESNAQRHACTFGTFGRPRFASSATRRDSEFA